MVVGWNGSVLGRWRSGFRRGFVYMPSIERRNQLLCCAIYNDMGCDLNGEFGFFALDSAYSCVGRISSVNQAFTRN